MQQDGRAKKDGKPCVTSMRKILLENIFCQTSPSFEQIFS